MRNRLPSEEWLGTEMAVFAKRLDKDYKEGAGPTSPRCSRRCQDTMKIRIGTRDSQLALAQSQLVQVSLQNEYPDLEVEILPFKTEGDRVLERDLHLFGGKGVFVKEIERALLTGDCDLAVHSLKDLPTEDTPGLAVVATGQRDDAADVLITEAGYALEDVPAGFRLGTSSLRRRALLQSMRPDVTVLSVRGNLQTRLRKLAEGQVDGLVLAAAGVVRLGLWDQTVVRIDPKQFVPAAGQGAIAIQIRANDAKMAALVSVFHDAKTHARVVAERVALAQLGGGCQTPMGVHAVLDQDGFSIFGVVGDQAGTRLLRAEIRGDYADPVKTGLLLANELMRLGALDLMGGSV